MNTIKNTIKTICNALKVEIESKIENTILTYLVAQQTLGLNIRIIIKSSLYIVYIRSQMKMTGIKYILNILKITVM